MRIAFAVSQSGGCIITTNLKFINRRQRNDKHD